MEPISIVASFTALVAFARNVVRGAHESYRSMDRVDIELTAIHRRLSQLETVLLALQPLVTSLVSDPVLGPDGTPTLAKSILALIDIEACTGTLERINALYAKFCHKEVNAIRKVFRIISWSFGSNNIHELLTNLENHITKFNIALTAYPLYIDLGI